jgi:hypothetical protein
MIRSAGGFREFGLVADFDEATPASHRRPTL